MKRVNVGYFFFFLNRRRLFSHGTLTALVFDAEEVIAASSRSFEAAPLSAGFLGEDFHVHEAYTPRLCAPRLCPSRVSLLCPVIK